VRRIALVAWLALTGCEGGLCSAAELEEALTSAEAGDEVRLGACEIEGAFEVPTGVRLVGAGNGTVLRSVEGGAPVLLVTSSEPVTVESLRLAVDHGGLGARAVGAGPLELHGVQVEVARGVGLGVADGTLRLRDVTLVGPITAANATTASTRSSETGTWGLTGQSCSVELDRVRARGFAVGAVGVEDCTTVWRDDDDLADVEATRGLGIGVFGGTAELEGVEVTGLLAGIGAPGVALAATGLATLRATDLRVTSGAGYGVLADGADVELVRAVIEDLGLTGVQVQRGALDATDLTLRRNGGAGVVALDAARVRIEHAVIAEHRSVLLPSDAGDDVRVADGIHVRRVGATGAPIDLALREVALEDNPRAGLLLDAAESAPAMLSLIAVRARADAEGALGVVAQRTMLPAGWDAEVTREGAPAANDPLFATELDLVGIIMPPILPPPPP
jgi:hypothetical protein